MDSAADLILDQLAEHEVSLPGTPRAHDVPYLRREPPLDEHAGVAAAVDLERPERSRRNGHRLLTHDLALADEIDGRVVLHAFLDHGLRPRRPDLQRPAKQLEGGPISHHDGAVLPLLENRHVACPEKGLAPFSRRQLPAIDAPDGFPSAQVFGERTALPAPAVPVLPAVSR